MTKKLYKNKKLLKDLNALRVETGLPKIVAKRRKCLKCGKSFVSMGSWNRLCEICYRSNRYEDNVEPYAIGRN